MAGEAKIRELLELEDDQILVDIGVFPPPPSELDSSEAAEGTGEEHSVGMSGDMLAILGLHDHWTVAQRIEPSLPRGRALRYDIDPRILLLEDIPEPTATLGSVHKNGGRGWLLDARAEEPAVVVLPMEKNGDRLVIAGAQGNIRMFLWKSHG